MRLKASDKLSVNINHVYFTIFQQYSSALVDMIVEDALQKLIERAEGDESYKLSQQGMS